MALIIVSLIVLAPFALLVYDLVLRGRAAPEQVVAPSYSDLLAHTGRADPRAPIVAEPVAA